MSYTFPASRVTRYMLFIISPYIILGVLAGFFWLHTIWGSPLPGTSFFISIHSSLMLYLVLLPFIMGVAYTLLPTFWSYRSSFEIALISTSLVVVGETLNVLLLYYSINSWIGQVISAVGVLTFAVYVLSKVKLNNKVFFFADLYIGLSLVSLLLTIMFRLYESIFKNRFLIVGDYDFFHLFLTGFVLSLIIGVSVRTMKFKYTFVQNRILGYSFFLHLIGVVILAIGLIFEDNIFFRISSLLFLGSVTIYAYAYNVFERYPGEEYASRMKERDWIRYYYFIRHINASGIWLLTSYLLLAIYLNVPSYLIPSLYVWDASLHSLTLGFIGNFVMAYGGIMLPPIILRKASYKSLSKTPFIMLNSAIIIRVLTDLYPDISHPILSLVHATLIYLAFISFLVMMVRLMNEV